jgi:imidazolonepropionase-like amidohydrolase
MIKDEMDLDMQETWAVQGVYPNMAWTPDSKQIVYWAGGKLWRLSIADKNAVNIPFHVSDTRTIYPAPKVTIEVSPDEFTTKMVRFASPSPDGKSVVFESLGRLFIKRGNKSPVLLARDDEEGFDYSPAWSLSGDRVYFLRWNDQKLSSIRSVNSRGGKSRQLNHEKGQFAELSVSADGKKLTYEKLTGSTLRHPAWAENAGLYLMDIDSGEVSFVTNKGHAPQLGSDGRVYLREREQSAGRGSSTSKTKLVSMTRSGLDRREIVEGEFITEYKVSPDGRAVAFIENHHIYVSLLPRTGSLFEVGREKKAIPTRRLSEIGGKYINWSSDSSRLSWSVGAEMKTAGISELFSSPEYEPVIASRNLSQSVKTVMPESKVAITGARLVTMNSSREVIEKGTLIIEGNRIVAIGPEGSVDVPKGMSIMDATGKTIIPGMIDAHAHGAYGSGQIIPEQNWNSLAHLALGVTTVHNPSSRAAQAFAAAEYARAGLILSPRIFSTGEVVYGAKSTSWAPVDSLDDALAHIRRLKAQGAFSIKNYNQPRRDQRQQVIEAVRQEGLMTVSEGGSLFHLDMNMITDGATGIEHNVPTLKMYDDVIQLWRQSDAGYTPTLVVTYNGLTSEDYYYQHTEVWKHPILSNFVPPTVLQAKSVRRPMAPESDYKDDDSAASAKILLEAGVTVHTGGHGQREGLATHWEMWSFVRGGMSPMQAISTSTINPAVYLGMDQDLGSLETGKLADLLILDSNPLENIRNTDHIDHVVLNGRIYRAHDLTEEITGKSELQPFWWQITAQGKIR